MARLLGNTRRRANWTRGIGLLVILILVVGAVTWLLPAVQAILAG